MSSTYISTELRLQVTERDRGICCYCRTAQKIVGSEFTIDHIVPESLGGQTEIHNLCLACWRCNLIKGNRIVGFDELTGKIERLFHPINQRWNEHFGWLENGSKLEGLTATGRATVQGLRLNRQALVQSRLLWSRVGWHPPKD